MKQKQTRTLTPYEKNQLRKFGVSEKVALESESPVEYLTNHVEFCGLDFYVDEWVLIPRIETEELIDVAVKTAQMIYQKNKKELSVADVGSGCGAIAICVSKKLSELNIPFKMLALEISATAIDIAKKNARKLAPGIEIEFKVCDLLDGITKKFDLVVANLPYIPTQRIAYLDISVKDFEPHIALDGGDNGLNLIYKMIHQAEKLMSTQGTIILEVDYTHSYDDFNKFRKNWNVQVTPNSTQGVHFVKLVRK